MKKPKPRKKYYPDIPKEAMARLFSFMKSERPDYYRPLYYMYRTGRRREETLLMQKSDVVMYGDRPIAINVRAETTKTKQEAPLRCIDEDLEKLLTEALRADRSVWLFSNRLGKRGVADRVAAYLKETSLKVTGIAITPHYLRHRFITECAKAHAPTADVKAICGIRDTKVLMEYYSHSTAEGQSRVLALSRL